MQSTPIGCQFAQNGQRVLLSSDLPSSGHCGGSNLPITWQICLWNQWEQKIGSLKSRIKFTLRVCSSCVAGKIHFTREGKNYHLSWLEAGRNIEFTWEGARNYCRKFCMDSITIDSEAENQMVKTILRRGGCIYWVAKGKNLVFYATCSGSFGKVVLKSMMFLWQTLTYLPYLKLANHDHTGCTI